LGTTSERLEFCICKGVQFKQCNENAKVTVTKFFSTAVAGPRRLAVKTPGDSSPLCGDDVYGALRSPTAGIPENVFSASLRALPLPWVCNINEGVLDNL